MCVFEYVDVTVAQWYHIHVHIFHFTNLLHALSFSFFSHFLVIRRLIIIVMNRLIRTPRRRLIHIIP
jgi:hypothetical protein